MEKIRHRCENFLIVTGNRYGANYHTMITNETREGVYKLWRTIEVYSSEQLAINGHYILTHQYRTGERS